ncbi:MAG: hypothetical protein FJZ01_12915 [Candidatus Sericytochromatia bacterium]|nr:hypothetical protein [Candidatus Tanganyikabacteria bacterium]
MTPDLPAADAPVPAASMSIAAPAGGFGLYLQGSASMNDLRHYARNAGMRHAQLSWRVPAGQVLGIEGRLEALPQPVFLEGYAKLDLGWVGIQAGHLRLPLGLGHLADDRDLPTLDRARYISPPRGETLSRGWSPDSWTQAALQVDLAGPGQRLRMALGLQDAAARLEGPVLPGVTCGVYYLAPNPFYPVPVIGRRTGPTRTTFYDLWGADATWNLGAVDLVTEYQYGSVGHAAYTSGVVITGIWAASGEDGFVLRYGHLYSHGHDASRPAAERTFVVGWNRTLPIPGARLQVEISRDFPAPGPPATTVGVALGLRR